MDKEIVLWLLGGLIVVIGWFASRKIMQLERADAMHIAEILLLKNNNASLISFISSMLSSKRFLKNSMQRRINEKRVVADEVGDYYHPYRFVGYVVYGGY